MQIAIAISIVGYFMAGMYFLSFPANDCPYARELSEFYSELGFQVAPQVSRAMILSLMLSSAIHLFFLIRAAKAGLAVLKIGRGRVALWVMAKNFFILFAAILMLGVIGDNISGKGISDAGKERSALIVCSVYGGIVWIIADLLLSTSLLLKRKF